MRRSNLAATGKGGSSACGDGVDVGGVCGEWLPDAFALRVVGELTQQTTDPRGSAGLKHVIERLEPFAGFERFELGRILRGSVPHQSSKIRYNQPSIVAPDICHETAQRQSSVELSLRFIAGSWPANVVRDCGSTVAALQSRRNAHIV
jgi:hypothetical protein